MVSRPRGRRLLERARRSRLGPSPRALGPASFGAEDEGPPPESAPAGVGWDHTARALAAPKPATAIGTEELRSQLLSLLADPRTGSITATTAAGTLGLPRTDVENTLDSMAQAGELLRTGGIPRRYQLPAEDKGRLEALFVESARELGEHGVLMQTSPDDALIATFEDDAEEPRLPVTAGLLSMFLPGTGQLLNGDVGRASLVFAVWSLAWITQLSPVWTFVCLYAGAEAFFTAKIRSMERKLQKEAATGSGPPPPTGQLPPKPTSP